MSSMVNFESAKQNEKNRQDLREARHHLLQEAKEKYEKHEHRKTQAKLRGEDTWMLPAVNQRLEQEHKELKKTKSKKKKKEKKKKKHKTKKKDSSSEPSSGDEDAMWVEKSKSAPADPKPSTSLVKGPQLQRESWMEAPLDLLDLFPTVTRKDLMEKKKKEQEEREEQKKLLDTPGLHAKELNPYWKDGGTGLPETEKSRVKSTGIGDGGLAWLRKSYRRCEEQAKEEGRSMEELAAERWGSLEKIQQMIRDAEAIAYPGRHGNMSHDRGQRSHEQQSNWRKDRFMKPGDCDTSARDSCGDKHRRPRSRSPRDKYRRRSRSPSDTYRSQRHSRSRSTSRDRHRKSRSRSLERNNSHSRSKEKHRSRSSSKERHGSRSGYNDRPKERSNERYSSSSSSSFKSRFMKPGEMEGDRHSGSRSSTSDRQPAWRKKEFHKPDLDKEDSSEGQPSRDSSRRDRDGNDISRKRERSDQNRRRRHYSSSDSSESSSSSSGSDQGSSSDDSDKGERSRSPVPEVKVLTEQEMNALGARIVKAEIMGNQALADKFKAELDIARETRNSAPTPVPRKEGREPDNDDFVLLTRTDKSGTTRPVPDQEHPVEAKGRKRKRKQKVDTHTGKSGERTRYFDDDDKFDLKTMVEREKLGTAEDQNQMFARLAGRAAERTNDDFQVDDIFLDKASRKQSESMLEERERSQAIFEHKKMAGALEKCHFCFKNVAKHLIVAIGTKVYLSLPYCKSLTVGHCMIVPMQHVVSSTAVDEDVWSEIQAFRKCLTRMFAERDQEAVFMETSMRLKYYPHMHLECVPVDKEEGDLAPIYFKKALLDCETEWSQNKKVVDISKKDIRHSIPKGFPYFAVDFGNEGGFAHVIEDEQRFPHYFGKEIIGGMIDTEHRLWRKPPRENFDDQRKKVLQFAEMWKPHDWTQNIAKMEEDSD